MLSFTKSRSRTPAGPQNRNLNIAGSNSYFKHCDHKNTIHQNISRISLWVETNILYQRSSLNHGVSEG